MKNYTLILLVMFFVPSYMIGEVHNINAGNYYYSPNQITINIGDTVNWYNDGGFHNVNGNINSITGQSYQNPESFSSSATSQVGALIYSHVFSQIGQYTYDCSIGNHAQNGMVGLINVLDNQYYDCNGILNGVAIIDDCGDCQQSYLYNFIQHTVTFIEDTMDLVIDWNQTLILANNPGNPYWNSSCNDCHGIANGTAVIDDCDDCNQAYIYNFISHTTTFIDNANSLIAGLDYNPAQEMIVMPGDDNDPYWNSGCKDCYGIINGTAIVDDCGDCEFFLIICLQEIFISKFSL